jgi:hypothetical protein
MTARKAAESLRATSSTNRDRIHPPGTRRRLTGAQRGHIPHVKLPELPAKQSGQRIQPLSIRALLG